RVEGERRPRCARLRGDVRTAGDDHELLQQLRPVPVPGKGDPAFRDERTGRSAATALRLDPEPPRMAACARSLQCDRTSSAGLRPTLDVKRRLAGRDNDW